MAKTPGLLRGLIIPDMHFPYHDKATWSCIVQASKLADVVICIGDLVDFYAVSRHDKDPRRPRFKDEIASANACLDQLTHPAVVYLYGNHEFRLDRYLYKNPELLDVVNTEGLLRLKERKWTWRPYGHLYKMGKLHFIHDLGRTGKDTARQTVEDFQGNIVVGHSHRLGVAYLGSIRGERHVCLNVGWGGDPNMAEYMIPAKAKKDWQHGFGWFKMLSNGDAQVQAIPIINNGCIIDSTIIKAKKS